MRSVDLLIMIAVAAVPHIGEAAEAIIMADYGVANRLKPVYSGPTH
jgi:hypothetical protein